MLGLSHSLQECGYNMRIILDKWRERQREMQARERPDGAAASAAEKSEKKEANPPAESELDESGDEGSGGGGGKGKATLDDAQRAAREAKKERLKKKKAATKALLGAIEVRAADRRDHVPRHARLVVVLPRLHLDDAPREAGGRKPKRVESGLRKRERD